MIHKNIISLYSKNHSAPEIAKKYKISKTTIYNILRKNDIKRRSYKEARKISKNKYIPKRKTKDIHRPNNHSDFLNEAEIIGVIMGDGHISKRGYLQLTVSEEDFMNNFSNLIKKTYHINTKIKKAKYYSCFVYSTLLASRIKNLTKNNKKIPEFILNGQKEIKARFLRGFIDSEGSMDVIHNRRQIVVTQANNKLLKQLQKLLLDVGIQSKVIKKRIGSDKLIISLLENLEKYYNYIGFSISYKQTKLKEAINYLKKHKAYNKEEYWKVLRHWSKNEKSLRLSAKEMKICLETYRTWIYGMKIPCQIKKDIEVGWIPKDYEKLKKQYKFLPII